MKVQPSSTERGQVLILIALAAIGLFGITGLAIDGSQKYSDRRHAQNAADASAMAAALAKSNALTAGLSASPADCPATTPPYSDVCNALLLAALDRAADNGYDNSGPTNTVEVYTPPISGPYAGLGDYVQVIITSRVDTYFARIIGINQTQNIVEAVALTREGGPLFNGASIVSIDPSPNCSRGAGSGGGSVDVSGRASITLDGGGLFINSSESCGYYQSSCAVTLVATNGATISSAGDNIDFNGCSAPVVPEPNQQQIMVPEEIYMPEEPIECSQQAAMPQLLSLDADGTENWLVYPGYYTDFPQAELVPDWNNIKLAPGVYCVDNDIDWHGNVFKSLDGTSGVTIYITSGHKFKFNVDSPIYLDASNSGDYKGYIMIQNGDPSSIEDCQLNGGGYLDIYGTIFAPYCDITINGNSTSTAEFNAQVIGYDIKLNGNNTINFHYDPADTAQNKRKVGLMR